MTALKDNANVIEENQRALETLLNNQNHSCLARKKPNQAPKQTHKQNPYTFPKPICVSGSFSLKWELIKSEGGGLQSRHLSLKVLCLGNEIKILNLLKLYPLPLQYRI